MPSGKAAGRGFTLLGLLFLIAGLGVAMAALGTYWSGVVRREKEAELLFIGEEYRRALESYFQAGPGALKRYPKRLDDLLEDNRFPFLVRHLRRIYRDPISGTTEWGLQRDAQGDIVGIHSLSEEPPGKSAGFPEHLAHFSAAVRYADWVFRAKQDAAPAQPQRPPPAAAP